MKRWTLKCAEARRCLMWVMLFAFGQALGSEVLRIDSAVRSLPDGGAQSRVALPDSWNAAGRSGDWHYVVEFDSPAHSGEPLGLYVPRAGNRLRVFLNDRLVGRLGRFEGDMSDHAQHPHFFQLAAEMLRPGRNVLRFELQGEKARYAGLSRMQVGPVDEVYRTYGVREATQVWGSFAIILVSMVFALIAASLATRTRDPGFATFAMACLLCAVRTSYAVVTDPPVDHRLWAAAMDGCYAGYLACLCLFCVHMLDLHRRWITAATAALVVACVFLLPLHAWWRVAWARQVLLAVMLVYALALCIAVVLRWGRRRSQASGYLAFAAAVSVALAVYDHVVVFYTPDGYSSLALARYSLIIFVIAMGVLLVDRFVAQTQREGQLRQSVANEVRLKTQELERHFDHQQRLASRNAQQRERQLLLQDIHDGMGLQLHGLLGMVQSGPLERNELAREVRTAIEQMRMLLDSTDGFDGDISMLLGDIRYRIEQRLQRSNIRLEWRAALHEPERVLPAQHAIALQRLVFELVTNTLKHSGASAAEFVARDDAPEGALTITYSDNGRGYAPEQTPHGVGSRSIDRRVSDLGASLRLRTAPAEGVRCELTIPSAAFDSPSPSATRPDAPLLPKTG